MATLTAVARSLRHHSVKKSKSYLCYQLLDQPKSYHPVSTSDNCSFHRYQSRRNLILQSTSESVKLHRFSDTDSADEGCICCLAAPSARNKSNLRIIEVNLDRPEAKNAIGKDMLRGLQHNFEAIQKDRSAKVVMIRSSVPKVFCSGADLKERKTMKPLEVQSFVNSLRSLFSFIEALHIPTIAVIEGAAVGGGLEMALSCDLRICGEDSVFRMPETGLAIIPGAGGTQRLPRLIGKSQAKELIFTGRRICATEAMSMGLVNYSVPAGEAHFKGLEIARDINQKGPIAVRMAKRAINEGIEMDMESALALEEECYERLLNTKDRLEGLAAFAEKRRPIYKGE